MIQYETCKSVEVFLYSVLYTAALINKLSNVELLLYFRRRIIIKPVPYVPLSLHMLCVCVLDLYFVCHVPHADWIKLNSEDMVIFLREY